MEKENKQFPKILKVFLGIIISLLVLAILIIIAVILNKEKIKELSLNPRDKNIFNASQVTEEKDDAQEELGLREIEGITEDDHMLGDKNAPVQMILYSDMACEYCAAFEETIKVILDEYKDDLVFVYRHFPSLSDPRSMEAAMASECAAEQGEFWGMYNKVFEDNRENELNYEAYLADAEELDLDIAKFSECYQKERYRDKIMGQYLSGRNYYVTGTPTFFLNKDIYVGAYPLDDFVRSDGEQETGMRNLINEYLVK